MTLNEYLDQEINRLSDEMVHATHHRRTLAIARIGGEAAALLRLRSLAALGGIENE